MKVTAQARQITDSDRGQVQLLHGRGMARNEIARRLKRSPPTVSKSAADPVRSVLGARGRGRRSATPSASAN
ncbi:helix-turn-helix domain-containing protein [Streptomyces cacaoi]